MKAQAPLSNLQIELLKMYSSGVSDEYLKDIKLMIAKYLFSKAQERADNIWDSKKYSDEIINQIIQVTLAQK
jgi:hypothetical protein